MELEKYFDQVYRNYERYAVIPLAMILFSVAVIGFSYFSTAQAPYVQFENGSLEIANGDIFEKSVQFTGGTEITYDVGNDVTPTDMESAFGGSGFPDAQAQTGSTGAGNVIFVKVTQDIDQARAQEVVDSADITATASSVNSFSASIAGSFFTQARVAILLGFTIMSLAIFIAFRDLTPSIAVILAAAGDIIFASSLMILLGIPLSLGSIAALLMLIGYSVDTDIVLSTRTLRQSRGSLKDRIWSSTKTGITMSSGGIAAFTILYIASYLMIGVSSTLTEIASVMVIGLLADMPFTWFGNAIILKKYIEGDFNALGRRLGKVIPWR